MAYNVYYAVLLEVCSCKQVFTREKWRIGILYELSVPLMSKFAIGGNVVPTSREWLPATRLCIQNHDIPKNVEDR